MHLPRLEGTLIASVLLLAPAVSGQPTIGREVSVPKHLVDGEEHKIALKDLVRHGGLLFSANWTDQEGGGRPMTKGNGKPLADLNSPLTGMRSFNRLSAPDANSCAGCHNLPVAGGSGDFVSAVFVLAQRFDFATLDSADTTPTRGGRDESGKQPSVQGIGNVRATTDMFGAGYLEMLARQITADLQAQRDSLAPGATIELRTKGISYGSLSRRADGTWDTSRVEGLAAPSLASDGSNAPPSLIIRPWHQAGAVVSLREFSNNAFNHHHGIQSIERFGAGTDSDGDGFKDEMTRADITAVSVFQATLAVPGRVIPNDPAVESAVLRGEQLFSSVGCAACHTPVVPLDRLGWIYTEPNPYNPIGNARPGDLEPIRVDLNSPDLPQPRLPFHPFSGVVSVPAFTDFKLHNMCGGGEGLDEREPLDMQLPAGSTGFFAGNCRFLTRRLWGVANQPPYLHHGLCTTLRGAVLAHAGEALGAQRAFKALPASDQDAMIEFLKTLQVLPAGTRSSIVDENHQPKAWPPRR